MLEFQRGNADHPTGNMLVYCHVRGHNPVQPGGDLIVCNVVVSYVSARSNHFPVVIFPPTSLPGYADLELLLELGENYDLVQLDDFEIPEGADEDAYVRERLDVFNRYVMEYVELCREHIQDELHRQSLTNPELAREISDQDSDSDITAGPGTTETETRGGSGANSAGARGGRGDSKNDGIKIVRFQGDEASALDFLEAWVKQPAVERPFDEFKKVIRFMKSNYPRYDIHNFERILDRTQTDLPRLYLEKFRAIYSEQYEQAAQIQSTIRRLETS